MKEKYDLVQSGYEVKVKTIRCDNTGENIKLKEKLDELQYGIYF